MGAGPAVWFGGLMSGVVREKERETGEEERGGGVGKKGSREGVGIYQISCKKNYENAPLA